MRWVGQLTCTGELRNAQRRDRLVDLDTGEKIRHRHRREDYIKIGLTVLGRGFD